MSRLCAGRQQTILTRIESACDGCKLAMLAWWLLKLAAGSVGQDFEMIHKPQASGNSTKLDAHKIVICL